LATNAPHGQYKAIDVKSQHMTPPIHDEYSDLPISKQRKYQLRHPDREKERRRRYYQSEVGKELRRKANVKYWESKSSYPQGIANKTSDLFQNRRIFEA
jgi:hypothetical protein